MICTAATRITQCSKPPKTQFTTAAWQADIYAPHPDEVDPSVVTDYLSWWNVDAEVHQGGANPEGIALNGKPKTEITIAIVALTVYVDV